MSGFSEAMKQVADNLRALQGPNAFDVVPNQLTIRTRTWAGGMPGADGGFTDADLVIPANYRIAQVSMREVSSSGGRYREGDLKIGPITPAWTVGSQSGGYTIAQLRPEPTSDGVEILYVITGTEVGDYQLVEGQFDDRFSYFLVIRRRYTTP